MSLRGHRDDSKHVTDSEANLGNFHALLQLSGDKVLEEHFKTAGKTALIAPKPYRMS